jgi:hypothetical protein
MIKKVSWGLFLAFLLLISSSFFMLKTNASDSQGKDVEDIITENFNNGHVIEIVLPRAEKPMASFRKADESKISIDKGKGEIRFERRGFEWIFRVSDIRLLHVTQFGSVTIYL